MTISKWLIALMCAGSAVVGSATTLVIQGDSECLAISEQRQQQHGADAAFEARPNTRGGIKGY